jgi:hypothetical protein
MSGSAKSSSRRCAHSLPAPSLIDAQPPIASKTTPIANVQNFQYFFMLLNDVTFPFFYFI